MMSDFLVPEFIGQIIDVFEDFLTDRNIVLNNPEIQWAIEDGEDPEELAVIYGTDYGELQTALENLLRAWEIVQ